jgi:hypothetical protein
MRSEVFSAYAAASLHFDSELASLHLVRLTQQALSERRLGTSERGAPTEGLMARERNLGKAISFLEQPCLHLCCRV